MTLSLLPIHPATLLPNTCVGFTVYISDGNRSKPLKFLSSGQEIDEPNCNMLRSKTEVRVFIDEGAKQSYFDYLSNFTDTWASDPSLSDDLKSALFLEGLQFAWYADFLSNDWNHLSSRAIAIAQQIVSFMSEYHINLYRVGQTLGVEKLEQSHSLRTGVYCAVLAHAHGYGRNATIECCVGGLLHDIGKRHLNDAAEIGFESGERRLKAHPTIGFRRLCHVKDLPEASLMAVYQHHEMMDGTGYPVQLREDDIHFASRICGIADRFDNMTSNTEKRQAKSMATAGRILEQIDNQQLDNDMLKTWLKTLKQHLKSSLKSTRSS